jgi:plastocyanin
VRRHPLTGRPIRIVRGALAGLALLAALGACSAASGGEPVTVTIASAPGERLAFEPAETTVPSGGQIRIAFRNGSSLPHNLVFTGGLTNATRTIVEPGASDELLLGTPGPGTYPFACTIHVGMTGRLVVVAGAGGASVLGR